MSLADKQTVELLTYVDPETNETKIRGAHLKNVRFNYTFLAEPRPADLYGDGTSYDTQLIIENQDVLNTLVEYFNTVYAEAVNTKWNGRRPEYNKMNTPFKVPKLDDEGNRYRYEEEALAIIQTKTNKQPDLFINLNNEGVRRADENDVDAFYSGMIGEAVINFWPYAKGLGPKDGIKAFINAVCKTDVGDPYVGAAKDDYFTVFGGTDEAMQDFIEKPATPVQPAAPKQPTQVMPAGGIPAGGPLADLMAKEPNTTVRDVPEEEAPTANVSLQDLINRGAKK